MMQNVSLYSNFKNDAQMDECHHEGVKPLLIKLIGQDRSNEICG